MVDIFAVTPVPNIPVTAYFLQADLFCRPAQGDNHNYLKAISVHFLTPTTEEKPDSV
jgi:hypothetical protein